ncbi:MAG: hypothetical protein GXY06_03075 [Clostridiaceae bacterium]|nr:hypothetical protein [Clostridiaceae bacterium]
MKTIILDQKTLFYASSEEKERHTVKQVGQVFISENEPRNTLLDRFDLLRAGARENLDFLRKNGYRVLLHTDLTIRDTKALLANAVLEHAVSEVITTRSIRDKLDGIVWGKDDEDLALAVFEDAKLIQIAQEAGLPTAAIVRDRREGKNFATLHIDEYDEIDDAVYQAEVIFKIAFAIANKPGCRIVGLDGMDLVGKAFFAHKLVAFLRALGVSGKILKLSDFKNPVEVTYAGEDIVEAYYFHAFNCNKLIEEILEPIRSEGVIDKTLIYFSEESGPVGRERQYKIDKNDICILEGVHMYREPLIDYFDMKIYLFMDGQEAKHRALVRDIYSGNEPLADEYEKKQLPAQKMYSSRYSPIDLSDFAVDNTQYRRPYIV